MPAKRKLTIGSHTEGKIVGGAHYYNVGVAIDLGYDIVAAVLFNHLANNIERKLKKGDAYFSVSTSGIIRYLPEFTPRMVENAKNRLIEAGLIQQEKSNWKNKYTFGEKAKLYLANTKRHEDNEGTATKESDCEDKSEREDFSTTVKEIVTYLNDKVGTGYRAGTAAIDKYINARLREGFTADECKAVIDIKVDQWKNDEKMGKYLRPSTLFKGEKFQGYLEEARHNQKKLFPTTVQPSVNVDDPDFKNQVYFKMIPFGLIEDGKGINYNKYIKEIRPTLTVSEQAVVDSWYK